jgi:hypothetical protein
MKVGCIGKSNTNNLPAPIDLTDNPYGKKTLFFKDATQKSAPLVPLALVIVIELEPTDAIFEKCSHLREKGGVLTLRTPVGFVLTHTVNKYAAHTIFIHVRRVRRYRYFYSLTLLYVVVLYYDTRLRGGGPTFSRHANLFQRPYHYMLPLCTH